MQKKSHRLAGRTQIYTGQNKTTLELGKTRFVKPLMHVRSTDIHLRKHRCREACALRLFHGTHDRTTKLKLFVIQIQVEIRKETKAVFINTYESEKCKWS